MKNSHTQSVRGRSTLKQLCAIIAFAAWSTMMLPAARATVITLTGGDPGEGYAPLPGTVYAYHFWHDSSGVTTTMQGVAFQPFLPTSANTTVGNVNLLNGTAYAGGAPLLGASADDYALQGITRTLVYGATHTPGMTLTLGGLVIGRAYQVDLFWQFPGGTVPATYAITGANGTFIENVPGVAATTYDVRDLITANGAGQIVVVITNSPSALDTPYISAFSVTSIPEPSTILLIVSGGLLLWRCSRKW